MIEKALFITFESRASGGFGIASTKDRLNLLYGEKASFEIKQLDETTVEAKVVMPVSRG